MLRFQLAFILLVNISALTSNAEPPRGATSKLTTLALRSPRQRAATRIRVLTPLRQQANQRWPVVYVLPVEAGTGNRWGDPLEEVRRLGLDAKYDVIWAFPTFADLPWYADHPSNKQLQQEAYLTSDVVEAVESKHRVLGERRGRYLLGFSKSGWGAWSVLLRHPNKFERAMAFDAPMMMDAPGKYGSGPIFGTAENFSGYQITRLLQRESSKQLHANRLQILGRGNFHEEHARLRAFMLKHQMPHTYHGGEQRKHHWNSGWLAPACELLLQGVPTSPKSNPQELHDDNR